MKINKPVIIVVIYLFIKIASKIDFHNNVLNSFFSSKYIKYLLLLYFLYKILDLIIKIRREYIKQDYKIDFVDRMSFSIKSGFDGYNEKIKNTIVQEFRVIYYAFFSHKIKKRTTEYEFTYHKNNSALSLYWAFILLTLIETGVIHYLLYINNLHLLNGVLLFINIYTIVFILGHIRAMKIKPIVIDNQTLFLNNGIFISEKILIDSIESIYSVNDFPKNQDGLKIGLIGKLEPINTVIELKNDITFTLFYGIKRSSKKLAFYIDDYKNLSNLINEKIIKKTITQNDII